MNRVRAIRAAYGITLVALPSGALERIAPDLTTRRVVRILGVRHVAQALLPRGRAWLWAGTLIDGLHALTCGAAVACLPRRRNLAALDALVAGGFVAGDLAAIHRQPEVTP